MKEIEEIKQKILKIANEKEKPFSDILTLKDLSVDIAIRFDLIAPQYVAEVVKKDEEFLELVSALLYLTTSVASTTLTFEPDKVSITLPANEATIEIKGERVKVSIKKDENYIFYENGLIITKDGKLAYQFISEMFRFILYIIHGTIIVEARTPHITLRVPI